jgi:hypothetical protein
MVHDTDDDLIKKQAPRSVGLLASEGISDSRKCANVLGAIALDVGLQRITPQTGNTMCNAIGKLMKLKELEIKHGVADEDGGVKRLALTD